MKKQVFRPVWPGPGLVGDHARTAHELRHLLKTQSLCKLQKWSVFTRHPCQS